MPQNPFCVYEGSDSKRCRWLVSEIMKITDESKTQRKKMKTKKRNKRTTTTKRKQTKTEENKGGKEVIVKGWGLNDFVVNLS